MPNELELDTSVLPADLVERLNLESEPQVALKADAPAEDAPTPKPRAKPKATADKPKPEPEPVQPTSDPDSPKFTKAEINEYLKTLTHDELKEYEAYNAHVSRAQAKVQSDYQRAIAVQGRLTEWDQYFGRLSKAQLADAREDDHVDQMYRTVKKWREAGRTIPGLPGAPAASEGTSAAALSKKLKDYYQSHDDWGKIITEEKWQELARIQDPAQMLIALADARVEYLRAQDREEYEEELRAAKEEAKAAHKGVRTPAPPKGAAAVPGQGLTREQYLRMSPEEASKLSRDDIDRMTEALR